MKVTGPLKETAIGFFNQGLMMLASMLGPEIMAGEGKISISGIIAQVT